jgi:4a-hydroxytetrahydrobiopterin dehydratase
MHAIDHSRLPVALRNTPHWSLDPSRPAIHRRFEFRDFAQAFAFMTEMATYSEDRQHHPEWSNVYGTVEVTLTTHDAGGITDRDLAWAQKADAVFARHTSASS